MRPIYLARMDRPRPVLILTRTGVRSRMSSVTVAPITSRVRGLATEVPVGRLNGLDQDSVVSCDNITTIRAELLGRHVGALLPDQEATLTSAVLAAFDLA
ncbi:MAG: type II toxin-antitoxin system PemK/MazF family toxin [Mycobacteriales bacterium]